MSSDDQHPKQFFMGNVENVAARDINFFATMSEWTGRPVEELNKHRALLTEVRQRSERRRWTNGPFICMLILALILFGTAGSILARVFGGLSVGLSTFAQRAPSATEIALLAVVFVSLQIAQSLCNKVRRREKEQAALAKHHIRNIDIELRRQGCQNDN